MDEEKTNQEPKGAEANSTDGDKPTSTPVIDDANLAAKRMEDATKAQREQNDRTEKIMADAKLGGVPAGKPTEVDDQKKKAMEFWKGTPVADAIEKHG